MGCRISATILIIALILPLSTYSQEPDLEPEVEYFYSVVEQVTIGVMGLESMGGVTQKKADALADMIAGEIVQLGDVRVITKTDINSMLTLEKKKRLAGCTDSNCMADILGALGFRWMVTGNISRFGKSYLLNLKLLDIKNTYVAGRAVRRIKGDEDDLLDELPEATEELFDRVASQMGLHQPGRVSIAARHFQPVEQSPSAVWIITRKDIEASGATTLIDLMRLVPGLGVIQSTPYFSGVVGRLQWGTNHVAYLVLIDGRQANIEILGYPSFETQPIFIEDVERIEVIRGPGSYLYGANAFAGVVNITTRAVQERTSAWIGFSGGEAGIAAAGARASAMIGKWGISVSGGVDRMGTTLDPGGEGRRIWKLRSVIERRFEGSKRLVIDVGISRGSGSLATMIGMVDTTFEIRSVRLAYESDVFKGQVYWTQVPIYANLTTPFEYGNVRLAKLVPADVNGHVIDTDAQWTLPELWEPLLVMVGGGGRFYWIGSDDLLDADTFANVGSPDYHQPGISHWELRAGAFLHAELAPVEWVTLTGSVRFDYNTETDEFISPRLAAVFKLAQDQFLRLSVARAFRKPCLVESRVHFMVDFPADSPIQGPEQDKFQEFMTQILGNAELDNEELLAFEVGYLAQLLEGRLLLSLDLYYNLFNNEIHTETNIIPDERGLPDLDLSDVMQQNSEGSIGILGSELSARFDLTDSVQLLASWAQRYIVKTVFLESTDETPQHLLTMGGRFRTSFGLLGSLYAHSRSEFMDRGVTNPSGLLSPSLSQKMENSLLLIGKIGWTWKPQAGVNLEAGIRLFQPISLSASPGLCFREEGGGITPNGVVYGGMELCRMVTAYFQGSF